MPAPCFRLGDWTVSPVDGVLTRASDRRRLRPKPLEVLLVLASRPGEVVTAQELLRIAWPGVHVEESSVARCIFQIRAALEDDRASPRYLETIPRRGYRLLEMPRAMGQPPVPARSPAGLLWGPGLALAVALLLCLAPPSPSTVKAPAPSVGAAEDVARALAYYRRGHPQDNETALVLFQQALGRDARFTRARAGLADAYVQRARRVVAGRVWVERALREAERAADEDPGLPEAHKARALALAAAGRLRDSLAASRQALALRPDYPEAWANLGRVLQHTGRWAEAFACFERRVALDPGSAEGAADLGGLLAELGLEAPARAWLARSLALEPAGTEANLESAWLELGAGRFDEAERRLERLVAVSPHCVRCWSTLAAAQRAAKRPALAAASLERGLLLAGALPEANFLRLRLASLVRREDAPKASRLLEVVESGAREEIANGSERWGPLYVLATVAALRGRDERAMSWLEQAEQAGYRTADGLTDPAFTRLRAHARARAFSERMQQQMASERRLIVARAPLPVPTVFATGLPSPG